MNNPKHFIAFQGVGGAYSEIACAKVKPDMQPLPCATFEEMFAAVIDGRASFALAPVENSTAGRVAGVYHLLPESNLAIVGEHYQPIVHHLLALEGAKLADIKEVISHPQALYQCRNWLAAHGLKVREFQDTAMAARAVRENNTAHVAAIASSLAGKMYGLTSIAEDIADQKPNITRFLLLTRNGERAPRNNTPCVTSLVFRVRSVPAALYKALGGFATNGLNITRIESYLINGDFTAAQFWLDVEGHPEDKHLSHALEELGFFASEVRILGVYPAADFRKQVACR